MELNTVLTLNEVLVERGITHPSSSAFLHPSAPVITIAWKSNEGKKLFRQKLHEEGVICYQTYKLVGNVGDTETTRNHLGMQIRRCRTYELSAKQQRERTETATNKMARKQLIKSLYCNAQVFKTALESHLAVLIAELHVLSYVLKDPWHVTYLPGIYRYPND
ncbi:hypothetical protein TNCV_4187721 [Trichonephila clavipes]|nr:hypothetical protein TNCV_4187721 [Trichonephila clavipes]